MFWKKPKIELFVRYCNFSDVSQHKNRLKGFSRQKCFDNLLSTLDRKKVHATFLLDTFHPSDKRHFVVEQSEFPVVEIKEGTETGSFLRLLDHAASLDLPPKPLSIFSRTIICIEKDGLMFFSKVFQFRRLPTSLFMTTGINIFSLLIKSSPRKFSTPHLAIGERPLQRPIPMP